MKYFGDLGQPEERENARRSSCIRIGAFLVIRKILEDYGLPAMIGKYFGERDRGLVEDLASYSIISENNAAQYYPAYAYNHPLFTEKMHIYSDTKVSEFLSSVTDDQRIGLVNDWNEGRDHREKIYISSAAPACIFPFFRLSKISKIFHVILVWHHLFRVIFRPFPNDPLIRHIVFFVRVVRPSDHISYIGCIPLFYLVYLAWDIRDLHFVI